MTERFTVDSDGKYWDKVKGKYITIDNLFDELNTLHEENMMLKQQLAEQNDIEWLRNNTVWEQLPTSRIATSKTSNHIGWKRD